MKEEIDLIEITFTIRATDRIDKSEFNALILRMQLLKDFLEDSYAFKTDADVENFNMNIEKMQNLLENFRIKKI